MKNLKRKAATLLASVDAIKTEAQSGNINALEAFIYLDRVNKVLTGVIKEMRPEAVAEAYKHPEKTFEQYNAIITQSATGGSWDFKGCNNWAEKKRELTAIENELKTAWELNESGKSVVNDDGEITELPVRKFGTDNISLKHKFE